MVSIDDSPTEATLTGTTEAKVAGEGPDKQGPNRLETAWDSGEVARLATIVEGVAGDWKERSRAIHVLRVLCDLAAKDPERLNPTRDPNEWGFLATEIGEALRRFKVHGADKWGGDAEVAQDRMQEHWPKLEETWKRQWPTIADALAEKHISFRPWPNKAPGGGSGNSNKYGFRFDVSEDQPAEEQLSDVDLLNMPQVRYRPQDISGNRLVHWMSNSGFYLGGWGGKIFVGVFLSLLIAAALWLWLWLWVVLVGMGAASTTVTFLKLGFIGTLTVVIAYTVLGWQFRLVADRVILAPWFLQPLSLSKPDDYLLELRRNDDGKRNTMYLVRYAANCPACGAKGLDMVRVESGRLEFFGRLVGRCNRAPNAHVFSFDHVSKQGWFLR